MNAVPSPNKPRKLADAGGDEVGEKAVAENELVVARLEVNEAVWNGEVEPDDVKLKVPGLVGSAVRVESVEAGTGVKVRPGSVRF